MAEAVKTENAHIVRLEGVCGGEPLIDGLRVRVCLIIGHATVFLGLLNRKRWLYGRPLGRSRWSK